MNCVISLGVLYRFNSVAYGFRIVVKLLFMLEFFVVDLIELL